MRYEDGDRIRELERTVAELLERVAALERSGRTAPERSVEPLSPPPPSPSPPEPTPRPEPPRIERPAPTPPPPPPAPARPALDLEELLGGRVLGWVGALAVVLGVVFFLATAIRRGWIDETTRVALAFAGSSGLLVAGLFLYERKGRTQAALAAVAGAIAALYLSTTAATTLYDLVAPAAGLGIAGLVGAAATAVAVRWESPIVGALGIVGAVLSPVLVGASTSGVTLAFMAIAVVSAAAVLVWQRWNWLALAVFLTSAPQLLVWVGDNHDDSIALVLVVLAAFWAVYVVAALGYELRVRTDKLRLSSASLLLADAVLTAGAGWAALQGADHDDAATAWVVAAALVHVVLGTLTLRGRISREVALLLLAVGIGLSAIGLALALDGPALVAAWSVEAVVLVWLSRRIGRRRGYVAAGGFLLAAAMHAFAFDARPDVAVVDPTWQAVVAVIIVTAAGAIGSRLARGDLREAVVAGELTAVVGLAYLPAVAFSGVWVVLAWAVLAVALGWFARVSGSDVARFGGLAVLALGALHVLGFEAPPDSLRLGVADLLAAAAGASAVCLAALALLRLLEWPRDLRRVLEIGAAALAVYVPSFAIVDVTTTGEVDAGQTPQVLLSAFWSLLGVAALVFGLLRDDKRFRVGGLALLGVAAAKVGLYDLAELDEIYRVLSFIALGLLFLVGAFAYQRIRQTSKADE